MSKSIPMTREDLDLVEDFASRIDCAVVDGFVVYDLQAKAANSVMTPKPRNVKPHLVLPMPKIVPQFELSDWYKDSTTRDTLSVGADPTNYTSYKLGAV